MGKGTIKTKAMTMAVAMSMVAGLCRRRCLRQTVRM